ncbi:MAG: hypothetical protein ACIAQU_11150, partial [Phycisphaerales bacterium JB064]
IAAALLLTGLSLVCLGQGPKPDWSDRRSGFPEPVDVLGVRVALTNLGASINVQGPPVPVGAQTASSGDYPKMTRSITVSGTVTPMMLVPTDDGKPRDDDNIGPTAVLRASIVEMKGDGRDIDLEDVQGRQPAWGVVRVRQQLSHALLNNPHTLLQPPPHLNKEQLAAIRHITGGFNATSRFDALPGHIERLEVALSLVHAERMDIITLPLEAMAEHKEIIPGVRFLVRSVSRVENNGRPYVRVELEYFIDRVQDEDAESGFEPTPLVPAVAIRNAQGQIVNIVQRVQETETRDQFIVSLSDISLTTEAAKAGPLTVDIVVLHGLAKRTVLMAIEDLPLAGD